MLDVAGVRAHVLKALVEHYPHAEFAACEDAIQTALERLQVSAPASARQNSSEACAWLYVVARNELRDELQRSSRQETLPEKIEQSSLVFPAEEFEVVELLQFAKHRLALRSLPQIAAVVWRDEYGLPYDSLAEVLGCTVNAAMIHHHRARRFLEKVIQEEIGKIKFPRRGGGGERFGVIGSLIDGRKVPVSARELFVGKMSVPSNIADTRPLEFILKWPVAVHHRGGSDEQNSAWIIRGADFFGASDAMSRTKLQFQRLDMG